MESSQSFYYEWDENDKLIMYLMDTQEKVYFKIPERFEELYQNFYACQLGSSIKLESVVNRLNLELIEFENYLK